METTKNPFYFENLKVGSEDWTDEHSVNILTEDGKFLAKVLVSPYLNLEEASLFAQDIVSRYNKALFAIGFDL